MPSPTRSPIKLFVFPRMFEAPLGEGVELQGGPTVADLTPEHLQGPADEQAGLAHEEKLLARLALDLLPAEQAHAQPARAPSTRSVTSSTLSMTKPR